MERQIDERLLKSEPPIVKRIENKSDLLSKLTLYDLKKRATRRSRRAREPSRIPLQFMQSRVPLGPGKFRVMISFIDCTI